MEDGYGHTLMQHQYPFTCLFLNIDGSTVDVNVHPSKMEVRFSDETKVYDVVMRSIRSSLANLEMIVSTSLNPPDKKSEAAKKEAKQEAVLAPFEQKAAKAAAFKSHTEPQTHSAAPKTQPRTDAVREHSVYAAKEETKDKVYEQQTFLPHFLSKEAKPLRKVIGQVFQTYWIFEYENEMYIMDQHAAHEKVLFEQFMKKYHGRKLSSQQLSPAILVTLNQEEQTLLNTYLDAFTTLGFEIEPFGGKEYAIHAVPYDLGTIDSDQLFLSLLNELEVTRNLEDLEIYVHRVATEACKAAVKGGGRVSVEEAQSLVDQLFDCEDPYHCPHGRPTIISMTKADLEKRFKRIV